MSTNYRTSDSELRAIADKIRQKGRTSGSLRYPDGYLTALDNMHTEVLVPKTITHNGEYNPRRDDADGYNGVSVNVPNSYDSGDEGKVVDGGALVAQTARPQTITNNGTYQTQKYNSVTVNVPSSGGGSAVLTTKAITQNGAYDASSDNADGYSGVTVNVPNSYAAADEGKVVSSGALANQTTATKTANGTYDTTTNNEIVVNVPNSYTALDEGKVVDDGALVGQTTRNVTENGTYDTTLNDSTVVNVPNTYAAEDEGKVVDNGALVEQTVRPTSITESGTYDTTLNNRIIASIVQWLQFLSVASGVTE